ncbi:MAG: 50S ribosomal protein L3, partial [Halorubrum sp.]
MPQPSRPRKGSLGYGPRTRADSEVPRIRSWPDDDGAPALQGFAGYKAGMTHVMMVNDEANSPREGMEEAVPVTVVETPQMYAVAVRAYEDTPYGQKPVEEVWATEFHEELDRALDLPTEETFEEDADELRALLDDDVVDDVRVITHTAPSDLSNVPKKKPDVMETRVGGGSVAERADFALDLVA